MPDHRLEPRPDTVCDVLVCRPPVVTLQPGDRATVRTLDCAGGLPDGSQLLPDPRGHCLAGPIAVAGARPGQVLAVTFEKLVPDRRGFTRTGGRDTEPHRRLGTAAVDPVTVHWDIDEREAVSSHGIRVPVRPFLGVVGMPPDADGEHSTVPPRARGGGNIDCRELVAGSTLYLPVTVPDACLFVGDGHAAQGDGEIAGTAIETGMTTTLTVDLLDAAPVDGVHAETPAGAVTFGFDADLNVATGDALAAMLDWLEHLSGLSRATALALASSCVDVRVTQVANGTWGVHAVLPTAQRDQFARMRSDH
ncbi:acetamidase/formamidase family protein [Jatrophihabitans fulvus]